MPYIKRFRVDDTVKSEVKQGIFLPEDLKITSDMDSEVRYRGIFEVPVYKMTLEFQGRFSRPDLSVWGVNDDDILWDQAELSLEISDAHAIQNQASLTWNQTQIPFAPGQGKFGANNAGIHALLQGQMNQDQFAFSIPLTLNGSEKIVFAPMGQVTTVKLISDWPDPSFQGLWLPTERTVSAKGFEATWDIPSLGRNYPQQWNVDTPVDDHVIWESLFGADLISPVDHYRMAERSIKYALCELSLAELRSLLLKGQHINIKTLS